MPGNSFFIKTFDTSRFKFLCRIHRLGTYFQVKSGAPLVQHALPVLLEIYHKSRISLEQIIEKASYHVAEIFYVKERGYIREGYYADLVLPDINNPWQETSNNLLYKCQWSPFENYQFKSKVMQTFVNGKKVYNNESFN